jgi:parallel beta-helix repeat protein
MLYANMNAIIGLILAIIFVGLSLASDLNQTDNESISLLETIQDIGMNSSTNLTTVIVRPGGHIQAAIESSSPGSIIEVHSGTYRENVNITKRLTIRGIDDGDGLPVVDANESGSAITISADGVRLENLTTANSSIYGTYGRGAGIRLTSRNCVITGILTNDNYYGIYLSNSDNNTISLNKASDNKIGIGLLSSIANSLLKNNFRSKELGYGMDLDASNNNAILGNDFVNLSRGIHLNSSDNNLLLENDVLGKESGSCIEIAYSKNNTLAGNNLSYGSYGISLISSSYNKFSNNSIFLCKQNFKMDGKLISDFDNYIDTTNHIDGRPIYYFRDARDRTIDRSFDAGMVGCFNCTNVSLWGQDIPDRRASILIVNTNGSLFTENNLSIQLYFSNNNSIRDNNVSNDGPGILLYSSSNNYLANNTASNCNYGISLESSNFNDIIRNNLSNYEKGIFLKSSDNNSLLENDVLGNERSIGIELSSSKNNTLAGNNLSNNKDAMRISRSDGNILISNNFNSSRNAILISSSDNNYLLENNIHGNEWSLGISLSSSKNNTLAVNNLTDNDEGIRLSRSANNTISSNNLSNNLNGMLISSSANNYLSENNILSKEGGSGIELIGSDNNTFVRNNAGNGDYGIHLDSSRYNRLSNNSLFKNRYNFQMEGLSLSYFDNEIDRDNLVDGRPIYYLKDAKNETINLSSDAGLAGCFNCTNIVIRGLTIANVGTGLGLYNTNNSVLESNNITNVTDGVFLYYSHNNTIKQNSIIEGEYGIKIVSSDKNYFEGNLVSNNLTHSIVSDKLGNNTFSNNSEIGIEDASLYKPVFHPALAEKDGPGYTESNTHGTSSKPTTGPSASGTSHPPTKSSREKDSEGMGLQAQASIAKKPTATEEMKKRYYEEIEGLELGQIVFTPPGKMWKGKEEQVVARISQNISEDISKGLEKFNNIEQENIKISYEMSVELDGGSNFDISPKGPVLKSIPLEGYQEWDWTVTPLSEGDHTLKLIAYAKISLNEEVEKEPMIRVFEEDILVEVDWMREVKNALFGGSRWIVTLFVTALVTGLINWLSGGILNRVKSLGKGVGEKHKEGEDDENEQ